MKKILLLLLLTIPVFVFAQIFEEDFEDAAVNYTSDVTECTDGFNDYFIRTDGTNINGTYNSPGGSFFFAAQDIDATGCPAVNGARGTLTFANIDITANTGLKLQIKLAEDNGAGWDASNDHVHIKATIDGGTEQNILWVESNLTSGTNGTPQIDTDFDQIGDGTLISNTFQSFNADIVGTGLSLTITVEFDLDSGNEDLAIDDLFIFSNETPLPITLANFTAKPHTNKSVQLDWITSSEENNEYFSIEHSTDGRNFESIDMVAGALNSNVMQYYSYEHKDAVKGDNYYRLRQVDTDGTFSFSPIEVVRLQSNVEVEVRPTLAESEVTISVGDAIDADVEIEVIDILGRTVIAQTLGRGELQVELSVGDLQQGHYFVRVQNGAKASVARFIKR